MKAHLVALVTSLYIVVALASTNIDSYGARNNDHSRELSHSSSHGNNRAKASQALRDHNSFLGFRDRGAESGNRYQGSASSFGNKAAKSSAYGNAAEKNFAKQDSKFDDIARQIAQASKVRGYQSASEGKYDKVDDNKARGYNAAGAKKTAYNRGKVFNDNIEYGFNKDYKQDLSERGGYEEEQGHNAHKLDEYKDKQKAHKLIRGEHTAANAREDAQHALKESKYNQNAAQKQAARGKFGNQEKKLDKAGATQDAQSVLFDRKDRKFLAENKGQQLAAKNAKQFANKDKKFGRQAAASHGGAQGHADKKYYGGHGNKDDGSAGGYENGVPHPHGGASGSAGHVEGSGGQANHRYGEHAKQLDQGKEHLAQNAGASDQALKKYNQSKKKLDFDQIKSLRNQRKGKFAQGVHQAEKNGFNAKDSNAAKSASGADRKYADATAKSNAKAAKHDLQEELFDKENFKRRLHDNNENFKKVKKFYHDKKSGGKNVERLKYNRKRIENEFGSAQSAQQERQNQYDNAHKAAKHHAASRKDNYQDAKKASQGFGHHNAGKSSFGKANSRANSFKKDKNFNKGDKKQIAESDHSNHKDVLQKKQQQFYDRKSDAASDKGNGYKNANGHEREAKGAPIGGSSFAHRRPHIQSSASYGEHENIHPVVIDDIPKPHPVQRSRPHFNGVSGKDFGNFKSQPQRSLGASHGHSIYDNANVHKIGGLFSSRGRDSNFGKPNTDIHPRFGKFGIQSFNSFASGSSNFGLGSREKSSVLGNSLFNSNFAGPFKGTPSLTSRFKFGRRFKGNLF